MFLMVKDTRLNLRITPSFRNELQALADYRGLTLSSLAHMLLVKAIRQEKQNEPEAFVESKQKVNELKPVANRKLPHLGKVNEREATNKIRNKKRA